jgi:hypothetical protein
MSQAIRYGTDISTVQYDFISLYVLRGEVCERQTEGEESGRRQSRSEG